MSSSSGSSLQNYNNELVACIDVSCAQASAWSPRRAAPRRALDSAVPRRRSPRASPAPAPPARAARQDLRSKREEVNRSILRDEEEKAKLQKELTTMTGEEVPPRGGTESVARALRALLARSSRSPPIVSCVPRALPAAASDASRPRARFPAERLSRINEDLARKMQARNEFDQTIQETEAAYMKILESSQTLLNVLKREAINLQKKRGASS